MSRLMLDGVAVTGASAIYDNVNMAKDHTIEVYITDADSSITALVVDLYVGNTALGPGETPTDAGTVPLEPDTSKMFLANSHTFTSAQLTAKKHKINVVDEPARYVYINISTLTGAGAGDAIDVYYDARG